MIPIRKKKTPSYLIHEVKKNHGIMKPFQIYDSLPSAVKTHLFEDLLEEQHYLCAYCMKALDLNDRKDAEKVTIDHFRPRSKYPDEAVTYTNLFGACRACQDRKGDSEMYTNPLDNEIVSRISYEHSGWMKSPDSMIQGDIALLELNNEYLRRARGSVLFSFIKCLNGKYGDRKITRNEWRHEKEQILKNKKYTPYIGIVLSYIERHERAC